MLFADSPPRRSYSSTFMLQATTMNSRRLLLKRSPSPMNSNSFAACINSLSQNGGAYNSTEDNSFKQGPISRLSRMLNGTASDWDVTIYEAGSTSATLITESMEGHRAENTSIADLGLNLITNITIGTGVIALSELEMNRNGSVVGLYLGHNDSPGHVVMGGYNAALIDSEQGSVVYGKQEDMAGQFEVHLAEISYISGNGGEGPAATTDSLSIPIGKIPLRLSYGSPTILLPEAILAKLLPYLGSPQYDEEVNGYVYSATAETDYSLMFTLASNTSEGIARITVPASSLLVREPTIDNPLTGEAIESGREYLLFAPLRASNSDTGIGYLGRAFLKHIYMVDDRHLKRFFIGAVNITAAASKITNVTSDSSELMLSTPVNISPVSETSTPPDNTNGNKNSTTKLVGSILGGLIGGIAILWLIALLFYFRSTRARSKLISQDGGYEVNNGDKEQDYDYRVNNTGKEIENEIFAASYSAGGKQGRRVRLQTKPTEESMRKDIYLPPTSASRSTKKAILASSPELARIEEVMSAPVGSIGPFTEKTYRPPFQSRSLVQKRFSDPVMGNPECRLSSKKKRHQSAPVLAQDHVTGGPYKHFLRENNGTEDIQTKQHILSYHQLLAHHRAHRRYASYLDSESSNGNDNDTSTVTTTASTETATVGKVIAKGQVAQIRQLSPTPPLVALANSLERRASIGRVVLPGEVVIVPPSRRTSRSSRELLNTSGKYPSATTSNTEGSGGGAALGHRRGKSAPSSLDFPPKPSLPPRRAQDDIFVAGVRTIGGQAIRPTSSTLVPARASVGTFLFEDSLSDSSSTTALPPNSKLVSGSRSEPEDEDNIPRGERRGSLSYSVNTTVAAPLAESVIDRRGSWLAGFDEAKNETAFNQDE